MLWLFLVVWTLHLRQGWRIWCSRNEETINISITFFYTDRNSAGKYGPYVTNRVQYLSCLACHVFPSVWFFFYLAWRLIHISDCVPQNHSYSDNQHIIITSEPTLPRQYLYFPTWLKYCNFFLSSLRSSWTFLLRMRKTLQMKSIILKRMKRMRLQKRCTNLTPVITFPGNFHCIKRVIPENNLNAINCISVTHRLSSRVTWIAFRLHHVWVDKLALVHP